MKKILTVSIESKHYDIIQDLSNKMLIPRSKIVDTLIQSIIEKKEIPEIILKEINDLKEKHHGSIQL